MANTSRPSMSAACTRRSSPDTDSRTRSALAPVAHSVTPPKTNGSLSSAAPPASSIGWKVASSTAGWMPKPAWESSSATTTSAKYSSSRDQAAVTPRKAGP